MIVPAKPVATTPLEQVINMNRNGDVIFIFGGLPYTIRQRVRVSSVVLIAASPVFKAMLGSHFMEGQVLRTQGTVETLLSDDNGRAMVEMLKVLHMVPVQDELHPFALVEVAKLADKYLCVDKMSSSSRTWLKALEKTECHWKLGRTLAASYYLNLTEEFNDFTRKFVIHSSESGTLCVIQTQIARYEQQNNESLVQVFGKLCYGAGQQTLCFDRN